MPLIEEGKKTKYEQLSRQIEREDGLVNTRLTWMLQTQGLLFAALALIGKQTELNKELYDLLVILLPGMGILLSVLGFCGVYAANLALDDLKKHWNELQGEGFIRPFGGKTANILGNLPSLLLPFIFLIAWIVILIKL